MSYPSKTASSIAACLILTLSLASLLSPASSSSSVSEDLLCPAEYAKKHSETDVEIGPRTSLIAARNTHDFGEAKEVMMLAMAGKNNRHLIVVSMPGVLLGSLDFGGTSSPSTLSVSVDAGKTFKSKLNETGIDDTFYGRKDNGLQPSPVDKNKLIIVAYGRRGKTRMESCLWITEDGGVTWTSHYTPFRLDGAIYFHPFKPNLLLAKSNSDHFSVHLSKDFGKSWKKLKENVRTFHWGYSKETIFIAVDANVGTYGAQPNSQLLRSTDLGVEWKDVMKNVHSFGLEGKFVFASIDENGNRDHRVLMVSKDDGDEWKHVQLPNITPDRFYSILDMSQDLIFIHVAEPGNVEYGTLFTSGQEGVIFSESLERHLFTHLTRTDFYRVRGMRGVYMTSKVNSDNSLTTMISYNRGTSWRRLPIPTNLPPNSCDNPQKCSLQLHISYSVAEFNAASQGPLSIDNATGLIIAHGHVGDSLKTDEVKVFISSDGGVSWRFTGLEGLFLYQILDFGGLIVAVKIPKEKENKDLGKIIYFSTDEGRCWHQRNFTKEDVQVKGLRSSPNGQSLVVSIWGTTKGKNGSRDEWVVITIDFEKIIKNKCTLKDYDNWTPTVEETTDAKLRGCLLGEKLSYKRLKPESFCHNDKRLIGEVNSTRCPCQKSDFDCNYGFERKKGDCVRSDHVDNQHKRPMLCIDGKVWYVNGQKYRQIPGDKCDASLPSFFTPKTHDLAPVIPERSCEVGSKNFLVVESTSSPKTPAQRTALAAIICVSLLLFAICTIFFVGKFISLRRERGSYRYSSVRASDEDEFEALIPNGGNERPRSGGLGDYVVGADDDDDDVDLDMELERGLAELSAPMPSSHAGFGAPPELPVSSSKSPIKAPTQNVRSYLAESDDDLIA